MNDTDVWDEAQRLNVLTTAAIETAMEKAGLSRVQLADKMGAGVSYVEGVLDGEIEMTNEIMARFGLACGVRWNFVGTAADDSSKVVVCPSSLLDRM